MQNTCKNVCINIRNLRKYCPKYYLLLAMPKRMRDRNVSSTQWSIGSVKRNDTLLPHVNQIIGFSHIHLSLKVTSDDISVHPDVYGSQFR